MKSRSLLGLLVSIGLALNLVIAVNGFPNNSAKDLVAWGQSSDHGLCESAVIRIMPLGDSITHGSAIAGGYRIPLWNQFLAHHWQVDFVGSQANGPDIIDRDHEGHPGKPIQYLQAEIEAWLKTYQPQIILLMIGTNNVLYPEVHDFSHATLYLSTLIHQITETAPNTEVIVASIPPLNNPAANERVQQFNAAIPAMAIAYQARGKAVHYVDVYESLTLSDLADGIHPNATGYEKIATVWYDALFQLINQRC